MKLLFFLTKAGCFGRASSVVLRPCARSLGLMIACVVFVVNASRSQAVFGIGDRVRNVRLENIYNYRDQSLSLSDFRGRLLIIDFWATWCSPCVASLPKLDSMQRAFGNRVQFLPVAYEQEEKVDAFLKKFERRIGHQLDLPFVTADTMLTAMFPHTYLPHYVWIDGEGVVRAITGLSEMTAANVKAMLDGVAGQFEVKHDVVRKYNPRAMPLMLADSMVTDAVLKYGAVLTSYIEGAQAGYHYRKYPNGARRVTYTNYMLDNMVAMVLGAANHTIYGRNRVFTDVADPERFIYDRRDAWQRQSLFCYERIVPPHLGDSIHHLAFEDLRRMFPQYEFSVEKRVLPCLALVRTSTGDKIATKGGEPMASFSGLGGSMKNKMISWFVEELDFLLRHLPTPVIDRTGYVGEVDLEIKAVMSNVSDVRKALKEYDLDLVERDLPVDVVVIRDRKP